MTVAGDRASRRASFDDVAVRYDRARPGYPAELVEDAIAFSGLAANGRILEVGCGTGKATELFAARGFRIDGVELGANLAALTRQKLAAYPDVAVAVGDFETWPVAEGAYDLAISAQAFHWIDPAIGYPKLAGALRPGGALALWWNTHVQTGGDRGFFEAVQPIYAREAPELARRRKALPPPDEVSFAAKDDIDRAGLFGEVTIRTYRWDLAYDATAYLDLLGTYSDHLAVDPDARERLFRGIAELVDGAFGGRIVKGHLTVIYLARRG
jgi:SAM-dependent methyltransferase